MTSERPPTIDPVAAARWQHLPIEPSPWLHEEVARRMAERLEIIRLQPLAWANWGALRGGMLGHALIAQRYPDSQCFIVEALASHEQAAIKTISKPWWNPGRWKRASTHVGVPAEASVQMLWANMGLHMAADPQALIASWHQALAVDGFLMFSCLGPDTLRELRDVYQRLGWPAPTHQFTDMHDWGDMLVGAGFTEPVMDMERITLSFETPQRLLAELRTLGRNLHPARFRGLRGRAWLAQLHRDLSENLTNPREDGRLTLTFEVIYGHALKPARRLKLGPQTTLSLDEMRMALRQGKGTHPAVKPGA
jgi:malonyl-CoA O-methyltransferase